MLVEEGGRGSTYPAVSDPAGVLLYWLFTMLEWYSIDSNQKFRHPGLCGR